MTQPPSHRITPLGAASLVALSQLTAAHVARAQTQGDITVSISEIADGDTVLWSSGDEDYLRPFNREYCETSDTITATFALQNLPSGTTFVDLWVGRSGVDCSTTDARQTGDSRQCVHVDADPSVHTLDGTILVSLTELLDPDDDACESSPADGETFYLWILATGSTESTGTVTSDEFGYVTFTIDASPPSAPTAEGDTNVSGDNAIPIEWSYGSEANLEYNVYLDTSVTDCSETGGHADSHWDLGDSVQRSCREPRARLR